MTCACGCGREIKGIRPRAANAMAGQVAPLVALLTGAATEDDALVDDAAGLADLAAEGQEHLEVIIEVLHGETKRGDVDKSALRSWTGRATSASTRLSGTASAMGFQGPVTGLAELVFTGRRSFGRVTGLRDTGTTVNTAVRVHVEVEVADEEGRPLVLTQKTTVSRLALPRVGENVEVRYDPTGGEGFAFRVVSAPLRAPVTGDLRLDRLRQLAELRDAGVLTPEEFDAEKARVLGE